MKKKSLSLNAFLSGIRSISNLIFPLVTFPYVSRVLDVDGIGKYNFSSSVVSYFLLIAALGISPYAVREGAKYRDDKERISQFSSEIFSINIFSTLLAYMLLVLSLIFFSKLHNYIFCILIFSIQIIFTTLGTEWIYTIYEEYSYITVRSIIFKIISLILLFVFVRKETDYLNYIWITVFSTVGSNLFNFIHAKKYCTIGLTKDINLSKHLKPILVIFASVLAVNIYVSSDTTILGLLKNDYAVGIYSTSVKIYTMAESLLGAILVVTVPRFALLWGKKKYEKYNGLLIRVVSSLSILVLPATVGIMMLSKEIIFIIAGKKYLASTNSLRIICWAIVFSLFSFIFSQCVLIPIKKEKEVLKNTIITALINVLLNFILIPILSYDGTSISTVISELLVMILNSVSAREVIAPILKSRVVRQNFRDSILGCLGIVIICFLVEKNYSSLILSTFLSIVLSILIYLCIMILLRNKTILSYIKWGKEIIFKRKA